MSKTFRPYDPGQIFLMPASLQEWLPKGHLGYFISDVVDYLDLSSIMERYAEEERGYPHYPQRKRSLLLSLQAHSSIRKESLMLIRSE